MKMGKVIVTTVCSLLMSGVAFTEIVPTPADNSVFELSGMTEKISAADNDYGEASAILNSFYDNSIGEAVMSEQTPVYAGGDYTGTRSRNNKTINPDIPNSYDNMLWPGYPKPHQSTYPEPCFRVGGCVEPSECPNPGNLVYSENASNVDLKYIKKDYTNAAIAATIGAVAGAVTGGLVGTVVGAVGGAAIGAIADISQGITNNEERYREGTAALEAAQRDRLRKG